jgi:hypothetical protein
MVTRTLSTPEEQAHIMFDNCEKYGVAKQMSLYLVPGQQVISIYKEHEGKDFSCATVQALMAAKIREIGVEKISHHLIDDPDFACIDISPKHLKAHGMYDRFVESCKVYPLVTKVLTPPRDPCIHIEMRKEIIV